MGFFLKSTVIQLLILYIGDLYRFNFNHTIIGFYFLMILEIWRLKRNVTWVLQFNNYLLTKKVIITLISGKQVNHAHSWKWNAIGPTASLHRPRVYHFMLLFYFIILLLQLSAPHVTFDDKDNFITRATKYHNTMINPEFLE